MLRLLLARGRALTGCACAVLAVGVGGCAGTAASNGSSVTGDTLTIYLSRPGSGVGSEQQDVVLAEQLAFHQIGSQVGKFTVKLVQVGGNELSDNARGAIADPSTIAYLGELQPGASGQTIGITNAQDILQVSPTDTAIELTQSSPAVSGSPDLYYESLSSNGRTFARVVPNDRLEALAVVTEMQALGVKRLYVASDGSPYGNALSYLIRQDGSSMTSAPSPAGADGVFYAGSSASGAAQLFDRAASGNSSVKLFAPSALANDSFAAGLTAAAQRRAYLSSPGFTTGDFPPQAGQFVSAFKAAYGHAPSTEAIFGYQAVASVLAALHRAGSSANGRGTVVRDFFSIKNRNVGWPYSAVGSYSIDKTGDVTFADGAPFVFSRIKDGKLVPFKAVQQQG
jgi:hypothetical protein